VSLQDELFTQSLRSQEPISGVCIRFHAEFLCIETHHEAVGCNGVLFNNVYGVPMAHLAPDDERAFDAIVEQMQAELGFGALATSEILVSYLKIFLIKATRLKISQDACATENLARITADTRSVESIDRTTLSIETSSR